MESSPGAYISDLNIDDTEKYYSLSGDELRFFQTMDGGTDENQLTDRYRRIAVQRKAFEISPYPLL